MSIQPSEPDVPVDMTARLKKWYVTVVCHIWPKNDLIEHTIFGEGCSCGATVEEGVMADGSKCFTINHNALDGRE